MDAATLECSAYWVKIPQVVNNLAGNAAFRLLVNFYDLIADFLGARQSCLQALQGWDQLLSHVCLEGTRPGAIAPQRCRKTIG